jgi:NADPH:quinone reductase-like Zn-dependent oxidoreductase
MPEVFATYPLGKIAQAEQALDGREHFGKIVVEVGGDAVACK